MSCSATAAKGVGSVNAGVTLPTTVTSLSTSSTASNSSSVQARSLIQFRANLIVMAQCVCETATCVLVLAAYRPSSELLGNERSSQ